MSLRHVITLKSRNLLNNMIRSLRLSQRQSILLAKELKQTNNLAADIRYKIDVWIWMLSIEISFSIIFILQKYLMYRTFIVWWGTNDLKMHSLTWNLWHGILWKVIDNVLGIPWFENWRILIEDMLTAFYRLNVWMSLKICNGATLHSQGNWHNCPTPI